MIDDGFYKDENDNGAKFYVKRTNIFVENGRTQNVDDEIAEAKKIQAELEAIEAARDQTYEEFKDKFEDHIDGKA